MYCITSKWSDFEQTIFSFQNAISQNNVKLCSQCPKSQLTMFLLRDNEKKVVFVVWRFHVCPNDWQLNQFHINPKREMHNLSTSASKTTIPFKLCSRVFNWILFSWIFFNRIFCSLSDRINLWGRTNRWSLSDKIYPTSGLSPIADMKHTCTAWNSWLENQQIKLVIASQFLNWW